jgi:hypothetical protein
VRQTIVYKEWAPDLPDLGADALIRAQNVIPCVGGYEPFRPLAANLGTVGGASSITGAFMAVGSTTTSSIAELHAAGGLLLYRAEDQVSFVFATAGSRTNSAAYGDQFIQFENLVIVAGDRNKPYARTIGSSNTYAALGVSGTNNSAQAIGVINQFVVIGNMNATASAATSGAHKAEYLLRWSGIDQPGSWPVANSATATAQQSGEEYMPSRFGPIYAIYGRDQYGVVLQQHGVSRMTYVGPPVVFQFDAIDERRGCYIRGGHVQGGAHTYFVAQDGFCRTDGVSVENIGVGKVNKFFEGDCLPQNIVSMSCAFDSLKNLVYFGYSTASSTNYLDTILIFSPETGNWSRASQDFDLLVSQTRFEGAPRSPLIGFDISNPRNVGRFNGTAGSAVFETSDAEFNPGGRSYVDGIKPNVESSGTAPAMTVRIGYRDSLGASPTYTSATSANSATGEANFRVDAKYVRTEITVTGNFDKATGFVANAMPSSMR